MIKRDISSELSVLLTEYPVVTILGPRQAGKTTLVKEFTSGYEYSNLEDPSIREFAKNDPKGYLSQFKNKVILDEIQRVPELLSYIQIIVDSEKSNGKFILTGSHQLQLQEAVTQSLAGRTAILNLLPLSFKELKASSIEFDSYAEYCLRGFLPRVYDHTVRPNSYYANYFQTYVERDVKLLIHLKDLSLFEKFLRLVAGRVGQLIDYSSLSNDIGVDAKTIKKWFSILEASFIVFKLSPYYENFGKRVIKSPKYYFTDVGLLCYLLGIESSEHVVRDPLVGNIFENMVVVDALKCRLNQGKLPNLYFFRDSNGNEVDIIFEHQRRLIPIEIKSSATFNQNFKKTIVKFQKLTEKAQKGYIIYNGDFIADTDRFKIINFKNINEIFKV